jgi:hypothetical protein
VLHDDGALIGSPDPRVALPCLESNGLAAGRHGDEPLVVGERHTSMTIVGLAELGLCWPAGPCVDTLDSAEI